MQYHYYVGAVVSVRQKYESLAWFIAMLVGFPLLIGLLEWIK